MAGGIASADMVIALAREGYLGSFGAAGLLPKSIEKALARFAAEIPARPFAVNLIHSPSEERLEREAVDLFLRHGVRCVEASAFMALSPHIVRYRLAGLRQGPDGQVVAEHRVIAKISRPETAERFMRPAPAATVSALLAQGLITPLQADLAKYVPMADDITVEADSGGHTDRRPLPALLPGILRLRDTVQREHRYPAAIRVGAAGGLGTPLAVAAAFAMGAAYVVTGSVNQSCVESGASRATKAMLAEAGIADCEMAPAADMFELGVELQVLKKGTLFPMRAKKLYELYQAHDGLEALPEGSGPGWRRRCSGGRWPTCGRSASATSSAATPTSSPARPATPNGGWRWSSAGTWGCPRAGRRSATPTAPSTTRSGAARRWAASTTG
ncbi:hypothetical protein GCM10025734_38290 [Kitasatospora paranensis]